MKFDKQAVQRELDKASEALDRAGHADLAARIDYYSDKLITASEQEEPLIRRSLARVYNEAKRRMNASVENLSEKAVKAKEATTKSRRSSDQRKATAKKRLVAVAAKRKEALKTLSALKTARKERVKKVAKVKKVKKVAKVKK